MILIYIYCKRFGLTENSEFNYRHLTIMLNLGIKGSCYFLHLHGRCGDTKVGLCLGHTLAFIRPCFKRFTQGPSWSWSYSSWIYNYLCNHCLSPLKLWIRTPFMARCTRYNIMW